MVLLIGLTILPDGTLFNKTASAQVQSNTEWSDLIGDKSTESFGQKDRFNLLDKVIRNFDQNNLIAGQTF